MHSLQASTTWIDTLSAASDPIFAERMIPLTATPRAAINFQSRMTKKFKGHTSFPEPYSKNMMVTYAVTLFSISVGIFLDTSNYYDLSTAISKNAPRRNA